MIVKRGWVESLGIVCFLNQKMALLSNATTDIIFKQKTKNKKHCKHSGKSIHLHKNVFYLKFARIVTLKHVLKSISSKIKWFLLFLMLFCYKEIVRKVPFRWQVCLRNMVISTKSCLCYNIFLFLLFTRDRFFSLLLCKIKCKILWINLLCD